MRLNVIALLVAALVLVFQAGARAEGDGVPLPDRNPCGLHERRGDSTPRAAGRCADGAVDR